MQFFTFHLVSNIVFLCAEKMLHNNYLDMQRKIKELDEQIEILSQKCANVHKKSPEVRHYCKTSTPEP